MSYSSHPHESFIRKHRLWLQQRDASSLRTRPKPTPPPAKKNPIAKSQAKSKKERAAIGKKAAEKQAQRDQDKVTTEAETAVDEGNNVLAYDWHAEYEEHFDEHELDAFVRLREALDDENLSREDLQALGREFCDNSLNNRKRDKLQRPTARVALLPPRRRPRAG